MKIFILTTQSFQEGNIIFHHGAILEAEKNNEYAYVTVGEERLIIYPCDFEIIPEPKTYSEEEVISIRSEWEKKYDELSRVNKALEESKARTSKYNQSLERKNKLLEEEMKHIEDDLILFHGTEFDRDTELAEIVNSLVIEVDEVRKIKKNKEEVLERQKLAVQEFVGSINNMMKKASESIANRKEDFISPNYGATEMKSSEPEFVEDKFDVMVLKSDLKVPQKEIVTVRHIKYKMPVGEAYQVVAGDYMGEFINIYDCIEVKS